MAKSTKDDIKRTKLSPVKTQEARERQLVMLAYDVAEKQLLDGTASSQVISHFLKMGSMKDELEKEILKHKRELMKAQTEDITNSKKQEELMNKAIKAFGTYQGKTFNEEDEEVDPFD